MRLSKEQLNNSKLLTETEVEHIYGINKRTLQRERTFNTGIPYVKLGKRVRYQRSTIDQYIKDNTIGDYSYEK